LNYDQDWDVAVDNPIGNMSYNICVTPHTTNNTNTNNNNPKEPPAPEQQQYWNRMVLSLAGPKCDCDRCPYGYGIECSASVDGDAI
jgi:hypothetical protein